MIKLVNLTKYHINVYPKDGEHIWIPPSGKIAYVNIERVPTRTINGIPVIEKRRYLEIFNLPEPEEGVMYIVDPKVMEAGFFNEGRRDLLAVDDTKDGIVKSDVIVKGVLQKGKTIGVRGFQEITEEEW